MPSTWTELRGAIDPLVRPFDLYTAYPLSEKERIGTTPTGPKGVDRARRRLRDRGYEPQYLSAAKRHPRTGQLHDLSFRRVPHEHPFEILKPDAEAFAIQSWRPAECQYHVHVFDLGDVLDWFSHYELRPDFFKPDLDVVRLTTHYRPRYGEEYLRGVTDLGLNEP